MTESSTALRRPTPAHPPQARAVHGPRSAPVTSTSAHAGSAGPANNGVYLHIEDSGGSSRPVVFIHGWPMSAQSWEPQVSALRAAGLRVVAYDRRGFGRSNKPVSGYDFNTLADDLQGVLDRCGLEDVTLVGFSMGGGEVARYIARYGQARIESVVFAASVTPSLMCTTHNLEGPLSSEKVQEQRHALAHNRIAYFDQFTTRLYSADAVLRVSEQQRRVATDICHQSDPHAALVCLDAFSKADFREDLRRITVPTLVIHGDADAIAPVAGSGLRTHRAVSHSRMITVAGAPHGLNLSHAALFNEALLAFAQSSTG